MSSQEATITFPNFRVGVDEVRDIGDTPGHEPVLAEISEAFQGPLDDLGVLIGKVAPHPTLQDNITHIVDTLSDPATRERIGYAPGTKDFEGNVQETWNPFTVSRDWAMRVGLQDEVRRPLMAPANGTPRMFEGAVLPGRVVNWMNRMGNIMLGVGKDAAVEHVLLASAARSIGAAEHPDVEGGTPEHHFMWDVLGPKLGKAGLFKTVSVVETGETKGDAVMAAVARQLGQAVDLNKARVIVPAVAGNWMQTGAQLRGALQAVNPNFDADPDHRQLWVASDTFPLGVTGQEPKTEAQNPASALGNLVRGAKLLDELR